VDSIREELRTLRLDLTALHRRIDAGEVRPPSWNQAEASHIELDQPFLHQHVPTVGTTSSDTSPAAIRITRDTAPRIFEVQNAFAEVRDKYSGSKLPADLLFTTSRKNVKSEDTPVFQVLSKVSKYCETGLKILSDTDRSGLETKEDTVIALTALMQYIQDEGVQLVVNKNYDKEWAAQYRSIMGGQTDIREEHINAMDRVATILKHRLPQQNSSRGRGRAGRIRGPSRGYQSRNSHEFRQFNSRDWNPTVHINNNE